MFFLLSKRDMGKGMNHWDWIGVVVAESADDAVQKIGLKEDKRIERSEGKYPGTYISGQDKNGNVYFLETCPEITTL